MMFSVITSLSPAWLVPISGASQSTQGVQSLGDVGTAHLAPPLAHHLLGSARVVVHALGQLRRCY